MLSMLANILGAPSNTVLGLVIGAVLGAFAKYWFDRISRRAEWKREDRLRWSMNRWETYADLLSKMYSNELLGIQEHKWSQPERLPPWAAGGQKERVVRRDYAALAESLRTIESQSRASIGKIGLVADEKVVEAAVKFRMAAAKAVEVLDRAVKDPTDENCWHANWQLDRLAALRNDFQESARRDLGVKGRGVPWFFRTEELKQGA